MLQELDVHVVETGRVHRVVGAASVAQAVFAVATAACWVVAGPDWAPLRVGYAADHDALTVVDLRGDARVVDLTSVILYSTSKGRLGVSKYRLLDAARAACVNGRRLGS